MGNSYMYPVLRTPDLDEAYALVLRLQALAADLEEVELWALADSRDLLRYAAMPGARMWLEVPTERVGEVTTALGELITDAGWRVTRFGSYVSIGELDARAAGPLATVAPVKLEVRMDLPRATAVVDEFRAAVCADIGAMYWKVTWPEVDELDLGYCAKYGAVEITVNTPERSEEIRSDEHTVWIHTRSDERAAWLAERAGARVIGPMILGY